MGSAMMANKSTLFVTLVGRASALLFEMRNTLGTNCEEKSHYATNGGTVCTLEIRK